ncbi:PPE domain-containing protein [Amycolatopsis sp., V23-08]|uniref:PPE domain-containing protein n=1 Tax=Amycolatopsis heterodermiae TaxID=3110235 RepID=A0ABU5RCB3_9PSEU|nr:PPE domain-containing protein [Amycolatopsis sp., V23-08]MEA5363279.1 PPE domain-containing protein [Amycolatopsis sp., V23-08]
MPEFHSTHHEPTKREKAKARRVRREKAVNNQEDTFGKINWDSYDHRELWDMVQSAEPPKLGEQAHRWAELAEGVGNATDDVHAVVQKLLLSWRGPSAAQAADSVQRLTGWASTAGENARHIGDGLDTYTSAIGEAQKRMPEPVHYWAERWFKEGYAVKRLDGPEGTYMLDQLLDDKLPTKKQADDAKAEAVRVMEQYEGASHDVRHRLPPAFDAAPQVSAVDGDPVVPRVPPSPSPTPTPTPTPSPSPSPGPGSSPDDSTTTAGVLPGTLTGSGPGLAGLSGLSGLPGVDGVIGAGSSVPGFAGVPGMPGGTGALGEGTGTGAGRLGTGTSGFGPGTSGTRGAAGGYGMYPPGNQGGARGEEDTEHRDKYANGYDLLDDLPPAYPPVFGE